MPYRAVIIAALQAAGLYAAGFLVPLLGQFAVLFSPVPLVAASLLHGRRAGALAAGIAAAFVATLGSGHTAVMVVFLSLVLMAMGLAEGMRRSGRPEQAILLGGLLPLLPLALLLLPFLAASGKSPLLLAEEYLHQNLQEVQQLYTRMGLADVAAAVSDAADAMVFYLVRLFPGILVSTTLLQAASCYGFARALVLRRDPASPLALHPAFAVWHAPDTWVWGLIGTLAAIAVAPHGSPPWFVGLNLSFVFALVYLSQGIALVEFFLRRGGIPAFWRGVLHAALLALPTIVAVIAVGVVDIWGDFRRVRPSSPNPAA